MGSAEKHFTARIHPAASGAYQRPSWRVGLPSSALRNSGQSPSDDLTRIQTPDESWLFSHTLRYGRSAPAHPSCDHQIHRIWHPAAPLYCPQAKDNLNTPPRVDVTSFKAVTNEICDAYKRFTSTHNHNPFHALTVSTQLCNA